MFLYTPAHKELDPRLFFVTGEQEPDTACLPFLFLKMEKMPLRAYIDSTRPLWVWYYNANLY
jgi:hypothetical protein